MRHAIRLGFLLATVWTTVASADIFQLIDLGKDHHPLAINNRGEILLDTPTGDVILGIDGRPRAFPEGVVGYGLGHDGWLVGLLGAQAVAGYDQASLVALPPLPGDDASSARARTASGLTVGQSQNRPVRWRNGQPEPLAVLDGWDPVQPLAVNNWWQPCGWGSHAGEGSQAVSWTLAGDMTPLPFLDPSQPFGLCQAITTRDEKFGISQGPDGLTRAVWWDAANHIRELPMGPDADESDALSANDDGLAVGWERRSLPGPEGAEFHALAWFEGERYDLNDVASWPGWVTGAQGWLLWSARSVNSAWEIVGIGIVNGETHGFLLTPTPPVVADR